MGKTNIFSVPTDIIIYAEKAQFENPRHYGGQECKQTERFSVI